ncbi:MAG: 3-methyl-2-oxobutanoate dehydrogenase subunit VorB [Bacillota bacterium]|nr:3-methyl-2-oxobutanoate dehydrogenase subunit VorB [Bacillota bacterium]
MSRQLMKGCEAISEAAIRGGCRYFFGYPITPQNDIPEYMSARLPEVGGVFVQAESEVAASNMVYGAAGAGARVMTSSSSPGISLKQEGISTIAAAELPCVIVNVMRGGPGVGGIQASQGDYFQSTKGGGHGDYRLICFGPDSVQEAIDIMYEAFDIADRYRTPVLMLADGLIGQMMEPVTMPEFKSAAEISKYDKPWAATGWYEGCGKPRAVINSLYIEDDELEALHERLQSRYRQIEKNEVRYERYLCDDAEIILVAYGTISRVCRAAIDELRERGWKVGLLRPISLWPFPSQAVYQAVAAPSVKKVLTVEISAGQMVEDVRLAVNGVKPVEFLGWPGSRIATVEEISAKIAQMREG